ncbi:MAG TPA: sigma-70 family RNA polymerase sigma factor [Bradyrhizobium sp.]
MRNTDRATAACDAATGARPVGGQLRAAPTSAETGSQALEQLLAQIAAAKDHAAFAALYSATRGKLFSTVLLIVRRWDLAEDIIQEVYARIWLNAPSYRSSSGSPMTWMITIARNLAIDTVRKSTREICVDDTELLALPSDGPTAIENIEAAEEQRQTVEQQRKVFCALQALDPARRELVIAAYLHGESREQLSKRAGVPVNTVKTWIRRALLEVQAILRNETAGETDPCEAHQAASVDCPTLAAHGGLSHPARAKVRLPLRSNPSSHIIADGMRLRAISQRRPSAR